MSRTTALVLSALVLVLAGAVLGARALINAPIDLPPPPPVVVVAAPVAPPRPAPTPTLDTPAPPPAPMQPLPAPVAVVEAPPVVQPDQPPALVHDVAVEDAWALVHTENVSREQARAAAEVFVECKHNRPSDYRCASGLKLAQRLQLPRMMVPPGQVPGTNSRHSSEAEETQQ
jgi:hypothetical protein